MGKPLIHLTEGSIFGSGYRLSETTQGIETSKYLVEKKSKEIPLVVASETGIAQTERTCPFGVVGLVRCRTKKLPIVG